MDRISRDEYLEVHEGPDELFELPDFDVDTYRNQDAAAVPLPMPDGTVRWVKVD